MEQLEYRKKIGLRIAEIRADMGLSTYQLADMTGIRAQNITRIEKGRYSTGIDLLGKIAEALGYTIDFIEINIK